MILLNNCSSLFFNNSSRYIQCVFVVMDGHCSIGFCRSFSAQWTDTAVTSGSKVRCLCRSARANRSTSCVCCLPQRTPTQSNCNLYSLMRHPWIMEVETIKRRTWSTYGYRPKSITAGLGCGLGCTPALSLTTAPLRQQLRCYINEFYLFMCEMT